MLSQFLVDQHKSAIYNLGNHLLYNFVQNKPSNPALEMQSTPSGRRYALVPGTATPSPELAQRLLERTIDRLLGFSPPDRKVEAQARKNEAHPFSSNHSSMDQNAGEGPFSWTDGESSRHQNHHTWHSGNKDRGERAFELHSQEKARRRSSLRGYKAQRASLSARRDKKRKHATTGQEQGRRYSRDVWEAIPHMSEIDSDDRMALAYKDVFEGRGHVGPMRGVRASSVSTWDIMLTAHSPSRLQATRSTSLAPTMASIVVPRQAAASLPAIRLL